MRKSTVLLIKTAISTKLCHFALLKHFLESSTEIAMEVNALTNDTTPDVIKEFSMP